MTTPPDEVSGIRAQIQMARDCDLPNYTCVPVISRAQCETLLRIVDAQRAEIERLGEVVGKLPKGGDTCVVHMRGNYWVNVPDEDGGESLCRECGILEIIDPDDRHHEEYEEGRRYQFRIRDTDGEEHLVFERSLFSTKEAALGGIK